MIEQKIPLFHSGNILKYDMLENLRDYAINFSNLHYSDYSDGIIRGCTITTTESMIAIHTGILLIDGIPVYITEPVSVKYLPTNTVKCLVARAGDTIVDRSYKKRQIDFFLTDAGEKTEKDVEICRFRLQQGAKLRYQYRNLEDMSTEFDTVCQVYAKWSAFKESTIAYDILQRFAMEAENAGINNSEDRMFLNQIYALNGESLPCNCIRGYLTGKLGKSCMQYSTKELYSGLVETLKNIKSGRPSPMAGRMRERRIIVD